MARRTKHEIKSAQKIARKYATSPELWAKCLLTTCYSIWFIHLPSCILFAPAKSSATLQLAYEVILRMHKAGLTPADEVCYRVMMQLCGFYSQPGLAVKLLFQMKRFGVQPNAITYGFYNRAVLEATWPSNMSQSSVLWNKLRNVVLGAARFRQAGSKMANRRRRLSTTTEDGASLTATADGDGASICSATSLTACNAGVSQQAISADEVDLTEVTIQVPELSKTIELSIDVGNAADDYRSHSIANIANSMDFSVQKFERFRSRVGSIVRPSGLPLLSPGASVKQQTFDSSAGLLMTGGVGVVGGGLVDDGPPNAPTVKRNRSGSCTEFTSGGGGGGGGAALSGGAHAPHRAAHPPASPKPRPDADCFRQLSRSESFANDAGILAKLKQENSGGGGVESAADSGKSQKGGCRAAKSLFQAATSQPRRGSLNLQIVSENQPLMMATSSATAAGDSKRDKSSCESLCRSPVKSPARTTPVTENDPLGALLNDNGEPAASTEQQSAATADKRRFSARGKDARVASFDASGAPVLFDRRRPRGDWSLRKTVARSATFHQGGTEDEEEEEEESDDDEEYGDYDDDGDVEDESPAAEVSRAPLHRSSTMPIDGVDAMTSSASRAATLGSTFKLPFSRYSPGRFSLRKADLIKSGQIIENAFSNFSPSSLTSKKSNELIKGGINSLKTAATSMAKKFDDLISANSTPSKTGSARGSALGLDQEGLDEEESFEGGSEDPPRRKISSEFSPYAAKQHIDAWSSNLKELFTDSRKGSSSNLQPLGETSAWSSQQCLLLPENLYPAKWSRGSQALPVAVEIAMSTCCKCHNCCSMLYDEEIMAGWVPEDSNLNTKCQFCLKATVPFLNVSVLDFRSAPPPSSTAPAANSSPLRRSSVSVNSGATAEQEEKEEEEEEKEEERGRPVECQSPVHINVPYLNPLVLRKELESILYTEGDSCLTQSKFVDEHPIIYWNMVWVFERVCASSHLPGLCLNAASIRQPSAPQKGGSPPSTTTPAPTPHHPFWANADHNNVLIRTLWDNPRLHEEVGQPMYILWDQDDQQSSLVSALITDRTTVSRSVMELVIDLVRCNNMEEPMRRLAMERHKLKGRHSLYRDILFLTFTVVGRDNIDQGAFDREYTAAYERLVMGGASGGGSGGDCDSIYLRNDAPLSAASLYCRSYFRQLQL